MARGGFNPESVPATKAYHASMTPEEKANRAWSIASRSIYVKRKRIGTVAGDLKLVEAYLAKGGKITKCPPVYRGDHDDHASGRNTLRDVPTRTDRTARRSRLRVRAKI